MAQPQHATTAELERQVIHNINEFGWHCVNVIEDDGHPPWTYTIGFHDTWNFPELILIGRSRATAHHILEIIATGLDHDRRLDLSTTNTLLGGTYCHFIEVAERYYQDYVGFRALVLPPAAISALPNRLAHHDGLYPWNKRAPRSLKEWQPALSAAPRET
jgi:hypothetical protein